MSYPNGTNPETETTSDGGNTRLAQQRQRRLENRRDRHNTHRQLHVTTQYPIRKLLVSA